MGILSFLGEPASKPIQAIGELFTSDDERLTHAEVLARLRQAPAALQVSLNELEATRRTVFLAGWRPALGWVCVIGIANAYLINPYVVLLTGTDGAEVPVARLMELVVAMLGLAGYRTLEKLKGRAL